MKTTIASTLAVLLLLGNAACYATDDLRAESVWLQEVEEMYQSDVETPKWVSEPSGLTVVRGVVQGGSESARSIAIRDIILRRLREIDPQHPWTRWETALAEREIERWLDKSGVIVRRFEQPFYKIVDGEKYEAFTREAWLLDLSDTQFDGLHHRVRHVIRRTQKRQRVTIGTSILVVSAMFLGCWLAFAVLDRITRGYYIGWLRLVAATVFLLSAGLALQVTRMILRSL